MDSVYEEGQKKRRLEDMPNLSERITLFLKGLDGIACTGPPHVPDGTPGKVGGCIVLSNISQMCVPCQIRMIFYHTVYNWDAYHPGLKGWGGLFTE